MKRLYLLGSLLLLASAKMAVAAEVDILRLGISNSYLVRENGNAILFDLGAPEEADNIERKVRDLGVDPADLKAIVISHAHYDHAGAGRHFQMKFNIPIIGGAGDLAQFKSGRMDDLCPVGLIGVLRESRDELGSFPGYEPSITVSDRMSLKQLTGIDATLYQVPGHTPGSLVMVTKSAAFVGDMFRGSFIGKRATRHLYMCDIPGNNRDITRILNTLAPKADTFYVGHFGPVRRKTVAQIPGE